MHCLWIVSLILAVALLFAGLPHIAAVVCGCVTLIELVLAVVKGKQSNDGVH